MLHPDTGVVPWWGAVWGQTLTLGGVVGLALCRVCVSVGECLAVALVWMEAPPAGCMHARHTLPLQPLALLMRLGADSVAGQAYPDTYTSGGATVCTRPRGPYRRSANCSNG